MNLPTTEFPMRAGLAKSEPQRLEKWYAMDLYHQMLAANAGNQSYVLHDGPPYANGPIHIGHSFNKVLKDIIVKFRTQQGYYSPYVPGWDCHGQPIEHMVEAKLGPAKMAAIDQPTLRRICRDWATENIDLQRTGFKRLGVIGDWDNPYLTYLPAYEAGNVRVFKDIYEKGAIYRGRKPIHWCRHCHTALAEAEIEYSEEESPSVYVAFQLVAGRLPAACAATAAASAAAADHADAAAAAESAVLSSLPALPSVLIWTTTPWTLPANTAVSLAPDADYVAVLAVGKLLVMAEALVESVAAVAEWPHYELLCQPDGEPWRVKGLALQGLRYVHPIHADMTGVIVTGDHVDLSCGTGAVHTAPGHGQDDYLVGERYKLPMLMPVDDNGVFDQSAGPFAGLDVERANPVIIDWLRERGKLIASLSIVHSYPHCWRCHQPVIFRATEQWFVSMEETGLREQALVEIGKLNWYPDWAVSRLRSMIESRPDWCISRQRSWGVPIPVFRCRSCSATVATPATFDAVIELFEREGADAWFTHSPAAFLPADTHCEQCGAGLEHIEPERDILDVWWESGVSHTSVLEARPELSRPAELYLEGSDQHRGWFQSSLLTSVAAYGEAPYKGVMSCGFTVDEEGRKMSKSLGNGVDPEDVIKEYGADVLRLWVGSVDNAQDVSISKNILERTADAYRRFRNTFRFLLSNIDDFDWQRDVLAFEQLSELDRWAHARLLELCQTVTEAYEGYRFHLAYRAIYDYVVSDLSAVYLDAAKDRLYSAAAKSLERRSAQTVLVEILEVLVRQLAPILSFTCDEVWDYYPQGLRDVDRPQAIALAGWPTTSDFVAAPKELLEQCLMNYRTVLAVRDAVTKQLEEVRNAKQIGKSQEAHVGLVLDSETYSMLHALPEGTLEELFIVAKVTIEDGGTGSECTVHVKLADGEKCPRCWNIRELGVDPAHPDVCGRCAAVLTGLGISEGLQ